MNSYFWGWHWVDWRVATATNAWTPDFKASFEAATALKTRFIAGQLILLLSAVIFFFFYWLMGHWLRFIWLWSAWKSYLSGKNEQVTRVEFGTLLITWFLLCYYCLRFFISKLTQIQNWDLCWFWWFQQWPRNTLALVIPEFFFTNYKREEKYQESHFAQYDISFLPGNHNK